VQDDKTVRLWGLGSGKLQETYVAEHALLGCDAHTKQAESFLTCGEDVALWDVNRPEPVHVFSSSWADNSGMSQIRFNPAEVDVAAAVGKSDRSTILFDVRQRLAIKKMVHPMRNNALSWNPFEPFYFTTASEDGNCYTFDSRSKRCIYVCCVCVHTSWLLLFECVHV
jgi:WD40 repeat protein